MPGDQLSRQWRATRAIEASLNRLTVAEIAKRGERGIRTICRYLEALQAAGLPLFTRSTRSTTCCRSFQKKETFITWAAEVNQNGKSLLND